MQKKETEGNEEGYKREQETDIRQCRLFGLEPEVLWIWDELLVRIKLALKLNAKRALETRHSEKVYDSQSCAPTWVSAANIAALLFVHICNHYYSLREFIACEAYIDIGRSISGGDESCPHCQPFWNLMS